MTEETKSNAMPLALGAVAVVVVGVGVALFSMQSDGPAPVAQQDIAPQAEPAQIEVAAQPTAVAAPQEIAEPPAPIAPSGPRFDTFRVDPDGGIIVAGRAEPGQVVAIMLAGQELERVTADGSGNFVALPMAGPSQSPRSLTLIGDPDGAALRSDTSYIVAPIAEPAVIVAQVAPPAPEPETIPEAAPVADAPAAVAEVAPADPTPAALPQVDAAPAPAPQIPVAPTVLQADAGGVRVVQSGPDLAAPNVGLDAITYDPQGEVQLSGRATGDGSVRVYLDNEPLTTSDVTEGGDWRIDLPNIETGVYTLRVDEVDDEGTVVSRIETPFKREEAADVAAVLAEETSQDGFEVAVRTVQPGSTLWAIAEESLGSGTYYVQVYEANQDLIRDPDLIYPGQIFRVPTLPQ